MKRNKYIFVALAGAALVVASCTDFDDYNEAYTGDPGTSIGQTLWQNIEGNAELSDFMSILDKAGYRQRLQGSQFYTVWAPLNGTFDAAAIAAHDSTWIAQRFINSHIANYNYQATGELNRRVHTLNEKSFVLAGNSSAYTYDGHDMVSVNIPTSNGTLHTINGFAEYFPNVYEYIFDVDGCDSISNIFKHYENSYLDLDASVEGPIIDGEQTYSDSVMVTVNTLAVSDMAALLDEEDSSYTMLIPTDEAYKKTYDAISPAFNYPTNIQYYDLTTNISEFCTGTGWQGYKMTDNAIQDIFGHSNEYVRDSLTKQMIVRNIAFSETNSYNKGVLDNSMPEGTDTLCATSRFSSNPISGYYGYGKLSNGYELFGHTVGDVIEASNGHVRVVDSLAFRPWEVWKPECNYFAVTNYFNATIASSYQYLMDPSNGAVLAEFFNVVPDGNSEPYVFYYLTNLPAASYNAYVVFVSGSKPYKYSVQVNVADEDGNVPDFGRESYDTLTTDSTYNKAYNGLDTCFVGQVDVPVSYVGLDERAPFLYIRSRRRTFGAGAREDRAKYDNNLKIAGVILRPVEYDEYLKKDE